MNRRQFFGNLAVIFGASMAPTIFIPKTPIDWGNRRILVPKVRRLKGVWSCELEQDLQAFHGLNAEAEISELMNGYVRQEFMGQEILAVTLAKSVTYDPINFSPRKDLLVTINTRV